MRVIQGPDAEALPHLGTLFFWVLCIVDKLLLWSVNYLSELQYYYSTITTEYIC